MVIFPGACKNCGAMTHTDRDCVERPRSSRKAAWKSGLDIAPDEVAMNLEAYGKVSYDAKRDQWKGYNNTEYDDVVHKYEKLEQERIKQMKLKQEAKKQMNEEKRKSKLAEKDQKKEQRMLSREQKGDREKALSSNDSTDKVSSDDDSDNDSDDDSDNNSDYDSDEDRGGGDEVDSSKDFMAKDDEVADFQGTHAPQGGLGGAGMRTTVRNLRIREDTPKYLRNLALDSAFYDPKSRAMRSNPTPNENPNDLVFAGDNFIRYSGDAVKLAQNQLLCWEMQARGENIDVLSNPSQAELIQRQFVEKKKLFESSKKSAILSKYTDGAPIPTMDPRLRLGQTEAYVEYDRHGRVIKGAPKVSVKTKYEEDVFINNHSSVFGSYYNRARATWGYKCCHSSLKNSYCTGDKGKLANDAVSNEAMDAFSRSKLAAASKMDGTGSKGSSSKAQVLTKRVDIFGEADASVMSQLDPQKVKDALSKSSTSGAVSLDDRKRTYNSMQAVDVTLEDMEAYRLKRGKEEDPMAALLDSEELLPTDYRRK